ncbi:MAG: SDR family oxidoreductase [Chloroflexi bacterium]|nr:SDR family oxidoreductase [Chloroflexota bacterium]
MTIRLEGKVAVVTGGSSGIGRSTALAFAREGTRVVVADVSTDGGKETVQMIKDNGGDAIFVKTDVTQADEVQALVAKAVEAYGRIDFAFNNAGVEGEVASMTTCTEENWEHVVNTNLKSVWLCMKYEILQMLKQGGGAIVNTASVYGLVGGGPNPAYVSSKHGVVGLTKAAALECAQSGIRVNAVCPGVIYTPMVKRLMDDYPAMEQIAKDMHPMARLGTPEEIAQAVVWLCSDAASFVTGHPLAVDGGLVAR